MPYPLEPVTKYRTFCFAACEHMASRGSVAATTCTCSFIGCYTSVNKWYGCFNWSTLQTSEANSQTRSRWASKSKVPVRATFNTFSVASNREAYFCAKWRAFFDPSLPSTAHMTTLSRDTCERQQLTEQQQQSKQNAATTQSQIMSLKWKVTGASSCLTIRTGQGACWLI